MLRHVTGQYVSLWYSLQLELDDSLLEKLCLHVFFTKELDNANFCLNILSLEDGCS